MHTRKEIKKNLFFWGQENDLILYATKPDTKNPNNKPPKYSFYLCVCVCVKSI